jgi:hypothetical protein
LVFWFWVVVTVLAVPPIAFGLVMVPVYVFARHRGMDFRQLKEERKAAQRSMWWWGGLWW